MSKYHIFEQNGKYGLLYQSFSDYPRENFLAPIYDSLQIENEDVEFSCFCKTEEAKRNVDNRSISEHNCAIVVANGKAGLVAWKKIVLEFKYQHIIKLTFCHYLCKEDATYTLYHDRGYEYNLSDRVDGIFELATLSIEGELTLDKFLRALSESHPDISIALSTKLFKDPDSQTYVSEYRYYEEWWRGTAIFMPVAIHRVIIENDFQIKPLSLVNPSGKALE
jgi:hypothetical protein